MLLAYGKTQNGSVAFFRELEEVIIRNANKFNDYELCNIVLTFSIGKYTRPDLVLPSLRKTILNMLPKFKLPGLSKVL